MRRILLITLTVIVMLVIGGTIIYYNQREFIQYLYDELSVKGKAWLFVQSSDEVEFFSGGLRLRGSLYLPKATGLHPGIVLTHGGTKLGRKLPLYQVLSAQLAQRGYVVLSFDFRGYGESQDPQRFDRPEDFDFIEDVKQAVTYVSSVNGVDPANIYVAGHSFGAGVVIPAGVHDSRVKGIIAIAPGRRAYELSWAPDAPGKHYPRQRIADDMEIEALRKLSVDFINPILRYVTIDTLLEFPTHPPVLLLDGALEDPRDLAFLRELYAHVTPPKAYATIAGAEHYFGVRHDDPMQGRYQIFTYWKPIMAELCDTIDRWIQEQMPQRKT